MSAPTDFNSEVEVPPSASLSPSGGVGAQASSPQPQLPQQPLPQQSSSSLLPASQTTTMKPASEMTQTSGMSNSGMYSLASHTSSTYGSKKCRFLLPEVTVRQVPGENGDLEEAAMGRNPLSSDDEDFGDEEEASSRSLLSPRMMSQRHYRRRGRGSRGTVGRWWARRGGWSRTVGLWVILIIVGGIMGFLFLVNAEEEQPGPAGKEFYYDFVKGGYKRMDRSRQKPLAAQKGMGGWFYNKIRSGDQEGEDIGSGKLMVLDKREIPVPAKWLYNEMLNGPDGNYTDRENLIEGRNGAVSSDVEICSKIGVNLMKNGGNAIDGVIGTAACIGTINMFASGVGGGGFAVVRLANGDSKSFNFREMAPKGAMRDMYNSNPLLAQRGGLAFAIPGEVDGLWILHQKYGKLPWKQLWKPSIDLNRYGFPVTETLALRIDGDKAHFLTNRDEWSFLFSQVTGNLLAKGEIMKRPQLAHTLEIIASKHGRDQFYHGWIAESLAKAAQNAGGIVTKEDFAEFFTIVQDTVNTTAFDRQFFTCQAPCSGPVLIEGLNIADGLDVTDPSKPVTIHRVVETMKWLSAGRTELGDPADTEVINTDRVNELMTKEWAAEVRLNISDDITYSYEHYKPSYEPNAPKGTSHISVLDKDGNAVALTTTVNLYWGALVHDTRTGIVLNSEMDDFSIPSRPNAYDLRPSIYNYIKPLKRPLSSTAPTIAVEKDGKPGLIIGASGGSRIVTSVFECIVKSYLWGYDLLDTIKSPRIHHQLLPEVAQVEKGVSRALIQGLRDRNHTVEEVEKAGSVVGAIRRLQSGKVFAVADWWRKGGRAAGY